MAQQNRRSDVCSIVAIKLDEKWDLVFQWNAIVICEMVKNPWEITEHHMNCDLKNQVKSRSLANDFFCEMPIKTPQICSESFTQKMSRMFTDCWEGGTLKGDLDASEIHTRRMNGKEVQDIHPNADGTVRQRFKQPPDLMLWSEILTSMLTRQSRNGPLKNPMDLTYMCVKHQMRLYVCHKLSTLVANCHSKP